MMMTVRLVILSVAAALVAASPVYVGGKPPALIPATGFSSKSAATAAPTAYATTAPTPTEPVAASEFTPAANVSDAFAAPKPYAITAPVPTAPVAAATPAAPEPIPTGAVDVFPEPTPAKPVSAEPAIPYSPISTETADAASDLSVEADPVITPEYDPPVVTTSAQDILPAATPPSAPAPNFGLAATPVAATSAPEPIPAATPVAALSAPEPIPAATPTAIEPAVLPSVPTAVVTVDGAKCNFRFCVAAKTTFNIGKSIDTSFTGSICHKNGTRIGTVDQSGEAYLMDGTLISKYDPVGLKQKFANSFFKTFSLKPEHKYSGIGHETPQQNQADFLNGKTWILPMKVFQILNGKGHVTAEVVGGKYDCLKFTTEITPPKPKAPAPSTPYLPPPVKSDPPVAPPVQTEPPTPVVDPPMPAPKICKFKFCVGTSVFTVGASPDVPFTGEICRKDGTPIGTIDESGEAKLVDGTPISKYSPAGLTQNFSPAFFRTSPIKATKYVYSGIAHQLPQQNQAKFLDGKTWILPVKAFQVLNKKGDVTAELVGGAGDCIKFSTEV